MKIFSLLTIGFLTFVWPVSITYAQTNFMSVSVHSSRISISVNDRVSFSAQTQGNAVQKIEMYVNARVVHTCYNTSSCSYTGGPYSAYAGTSISYAAKSFDKRMNSAWSGYSYIRVSSNNQNNRNQNHDEGHDDHDDHDSHADDHEDDPDHDNHAGHDHNDHEDHSNHGNHNARGSSSTSSNQNSSHHANHDDHSDHSNHNSGSSIISSPQVNQPHNHNSHAGHNHAAHQAPAQSSNTNNNNNNHVGHNHNSHAGHNHAAHAQPVQAPQSPKPVTSSHQTAANSQHAAHDGHDHDDHSGHAHSTLKNVSNNTSQSKKSVSSQVQDHNNHDEHNHNHKSVAVANNISHNAHDDHDGHNHAHISSQLLNFNEKVFVGKNKKTYTQNDFWLNSFNSEMFQHNGSHIIHWEKPNQDYNGFLVFWSQQEIPTDLNDMVPESLPKNRLFYAPKNLKNGKFLAYVFPYIELQDGTKKMIEPGYRIERTLTNIPEVAVAEQSWWKKMFWFF